MSDFEMQLLNALEQTGILNHYRAQIRASLYNTVDPRSNLSPVQRPESCQVMETTNGQICAELIRDFLENYSLENTQSVFIPECHLPNEKRHHSFLEDKLHLRVQKGKPWLISLLERLAYLEQRVNEQTKGGRPGQKQQIAPIQPQARSNNMRVQKAVRDKPEGRRSEEEDRLGSLPKIKFQ